MATTMREWKTIKVLFKPRKQKLCVKTYQRNKKGSQSITKPTEILKEMEKF